MTNYTTEELTEALRAVDSIIHKCEKAQEKFPEGNSHHTLLRNRLKAMYISKGLIKGTLAKRKSAAVPQAFSDESCYSALLLANLEQLHTTELGAERIRRNLRLDTEDVVGWCLEKIKSASAEITRKGKNWYILADGCEITVNAHSYTVITAHRQT